MAGYDRTIDPLTGDYVDATGGEYQETLTIRTAIYHQLRTERLRWWGDPYAGSELYLAKHQGTGIVGARFADNAIRQALQPFVDEGLAADLQVDVTADARGRIIIDSSITDIQNGEIDIAPLAPIGEV